MKETGIKPELPENLKNILTNGEFTKKKNMKNYLKDLKKIQNYILERV